MNKTQYIDRNKRIVADSSLLTMRELCNKYKLSDSRIYEILKENHLIGCTRKNVRRYPKKNLLQKCTVDETYFAQINTPKKAYWLGYICADGYISKIGYTVLTSIDKEIIEKFKLDISASYKLQEKRIIDKRTNKVSHIYSICISNKKFTQYIVDQGVTNSKTDILTFPNIPEELYSYFIAGLFDGDGSVYLKNNKASIILNANLISTKQVLDFIQNHFEKYNIKRHAYTKVSENKDNVFKVYWYKDAVKVLDFIYQGDPETYMSRKYNLYKTYRHLKPTRHRIQPILQYTLDGNFVKQYSSMIEARKTVNVVNASICQAAKRRISCKKFYWIYYNEDDIIYNKIDINLWKKTNMVKAVEICPNG